MNEILLKIYFILYYYLKMINLIFKMYLCQYYDLNLIPHKNSIHKHKYFFNYLKYMNNTPIKIHFLFYFYLKIINLIFKMY